jgi:hypothetical protein
MDRTTFDIDPSSLVLDLGYWFGRGMSDGVRCGFYLSTRSAGIGGVSSFRFFSITINPVIKSFQKSFARFWALCGLHSIGGKVAF